MTKTMNLTVEPLNPQPTEKTWALSPLDQVAPHRYIRVILCAPLNASTDENRAKISKSLQIGLQRTLTQIPFLCGVLRENNDGSGRFHIAAGPGVLFRSVDMTDDEDFSYQKLKAAHFPPSELKADLLAPVGLIPDENAGVMAVQATFVSCGLLLTVCFHHFTVDVTAVETVLRAWAENTRLSQEGISGSKSTNLFPELLDRTPLSGSGGPNPKESGLDPKEKIKDFPQYKLLSSAPPSLDENSTHAQPTPPSSPPLKSTVLYFSAAKLSALKSLANPPTTSSPTSYISTNDAMTALLWHSIIKARRPVYPQQSRFLFAINCRKLFDPILPSPYLGGAIVYGFADRSIISPPPSEQSHSESSSHSHLHSELSKSALAIRNAITQITNKQVLELISLINSLSRMTDLVPSFDCVSGPDVFMTSWRDLRISDLNFGRSSIGKVERLRVLTTAVDGRMLVLPAMEEDDGGLEVFIGLKAPVMDRLTSDEELLRFAEVRCL